MSDTIHTTRPAHARSTIINGRYAHTSASQVSEFRTKCKRKWYYKKVCKIEEPGTPAQRRGKQVHSAIEHFLGTGEVAPPAETEANLSVALATVDPADLVEFVSIAAPFMPRDEPHEVEREVLLYTFVHGPLWVGYIDLRYPGKRIVDHKTTSDFRYCKTPEELRDDTQMNSYARFEYEQGAKGDIELAHLYLRTRGKKLANYVSAMTSKDHVDEIWARDMAAVAEMSQIIQQLGVTEDHGDDVEPNTDSCGAYGGCYFRNRCGIGDFSISSFVAAGALNRAKRTGELVAQGATTTETDVQFVATTTGRPHMTFEERVQLKLKERPNGAPMPRPPADAAPLPQTHKMPEASSAGLSLEERLKRLPQDILPEDAPDREALPGPEPTPPPPPSKRKAKVAAAPKAESVFVDEAQPPMVRCGTLMNSPTPTPTPPAKPTLAERLAEIERERAQLLQQEAAHREEFLAGLDTTAPARTLEGFVKRPDGIQVPEGSSADPAAMAPGEAVAALGTSSGSSAWERGETLVTPPVAAKKPRPQFTLYIDCFPIKGGDRNSYVLAEEFIQPLMLEVAEEHGVVDYRMIPYTNKALLAQKVRLAMDQVPAALVVTSYGAGSSEILESLIPWATTVIKGK
jgi:hypothetical protein